MIPGNPIDSAKRFLSLSLFLRRPLFLPPSLSLSLNLSVYLILSFFLFFCHVLFFLFLLYLLLLLLLFLHSLFPSLSLLCFCRSVSFSPYLFLVSLRVAISPDLALGLLYREKGNLELSENSIRLCTRHSTSR